MNPVDVLLDIPQKRHCLRTAHFGGNIECETEYAI
jgi:hypothetical protein